MGKLKCISPVFFFLPDQIFVLFPYKNQEKNPQFFATAFKAYKIVKFYFRLGTTPCKTEDWG